ncbi:MAG: ABC transporter ATP-binding protein, partial [Acidobacteriota bacterium]
MIRVKDLHCGYPGHDVLRGVSFHATPGEFIGVLGPNGAGKTTLLLALSGIIPARSGEIEILGSSLERLKHRERARRTAVVAQESNVRLPFTCGEVVRMGRYPHQGRWGAGSPDDAAVVERVLDITDTRELSERFITAVSGGERQRVVMAKALAQQAPILLLDEATSAMDIHRKLQVFRV